MNFIGILLAIGLLLFVANDIYYVSSSWSAFKADDVAIHVQFQTLSFLVAAWHLWLTRRSWHSDSSIHCKLVASLLLLFVLVVLNSLFMPLAHHAESVDGTIGVRLILAVALLASGITLFVWSWRVGDRSHPPELVREPYKDNDAESDV